MIKLKKGKEAANILDKEGNCRLTKATYDLCNSYNSNQAEINNGKSKLDFDSKLYGNPDLKEQLRENQNGKCAFCEKHIVSTSYGDVEHFRPKAGFSQNVKDKLNKPGYYWLAYDWNNLLFVCQICNQRHKKNFFPIKNPERRAINHTYDFKKEKSFLINPYVENPNHLIGFHKEVAYGKDKGNRGKKTVEIIGLNRSSRNSIYKDLLEERRDHYMLLKTIHKISLKDSGDSLSSEEIEEAKKTIKNAKSSNSKFSAMVKENFS